MSVSFILHFVRIKTNSEVESVLGVLQRLAGLVVLGKSGVGEEWAFILNPNPSKVRFLKRLPEGV